MIFLILSEAYKYNKVYLTTKNADNIYITTRLKEIESERRSRGLIDLVLPLTRIEFQTYLLRERSALSKAERRSVMEWTCVFCACALISIGCTQLEDHIQATIMVTMSTTCKEMYIEKNTHTKYRMSIYVILCILPIMITVQSYILRMRSLICDYFYADMVSIRARHLYYKILHDRHTFGRHIRRKITLLAETRRLIRRISCLHMMYAILPNVLQTICSLGRMRKCMVCDCVAYWKTVTCDEETCRAEYCYDCYVDAGESCLACMTHTDPRTPTTMFRACKAVDV